MRKPHQAMIRPQPAATPQKPAKRGRIAKAHQRPQLTIVQDSCVLCGGIIRRMDRTVYIEHLRCAPCHEALDD